VLRYHVAYYLPKGDDRMVVVEVLDFPGVVSQGFDLADARGNSPLRMGPKQDFFSRVFATAGGEP
jgi:hypothetical protein